MWGAVCPGFFQQPRAYLPNSKIQVFLEKGWGLCTSISQDLILNILL